MQEFQREENLHTSILFLELARRTSPHHCEESLWGEFGNREKTGVTTYQSERARAKLHASGLGSVQGHDVLVELFR